MGSPKGLSNKLVVSGCDQQGGDANRSRGPIGGIVRQCESASPLVQEPVADDCSCMVLQIARFRGDAIARCGVRSI